MTTEGKPNASIVSAALRVELSFKNPAQKNRRYTPPMQKTRVMKFTKNRKRVQNIKSSDIFKWSHDESFGITVRKKYIKYCGTV